MNEFSFYLKHYIGVGFHATEMHFSTSQPKPQVHHSGKVIKRNPGFLCNNLKPNCNHTFNFKNKFLNVMPSYFIFTVNINTWCGNLILSCWLRDIIRHMIYLTDIWNLNITSCLPNWGFNILLSINLF